MANTTRSPPEECAATSVIRSRVLQAKLFLYCLHLVASFLWKFSLSLAVLYLLPQQLRKEQCLKRGKSVMIYWIILLALRLTVSCGMMGERRSGHSCVRAGSRSSRSGHVPAASRQSACVTQETDRCSVLHAAGWFFSQIFNIHTAGCKAGSLTDTHAGTHAHMRTDFSSLSQFFVIPPSDFKLKLSSLM